MPAGNSNKTARVPGRPFGPGKSGNPNGRPKQTQEQKDALTMIRSLAPDAAEKLRDMLHDPETKPDIRVRIIDMILERTYGKAVAQMAVSVGSFEALDAAFEGIKGDDE